MEESPASTPAAPRTIVRAAAALTVLALLALVTVALGSDYARRWFGGATAAAFHGRDISQENWQAAFTLTDMAGQQRSLSDFRGKVVLLSFGYTHCPDVCPTTLAKFAEVRRLLGAQGDRVQGLFVTIDPERDSAELLRSYVPAFDPSFIGLRGTEAQTDAATKAFHANYQIVEYRGNILVDHTAATFVIDAGGKARVVTPYDQSARALADDVIAILRAG
jgi:protein SCO1